VQLAGLRKGGCCYLGVALITIRCRRVDKRRQMKQRRGHRVAGRARPAAVHFWMDCGVLRVALYKQRCSEQVLCAGIST
jgi:hypothetical protein